MLTDVYPGSRIQDLVVPLDPNWTAFNPSIAHDGNGLPFCTIRQSNFVMDQNGQYQIMDPERVIRTKNLLATLDPDSLTVTDLRPIDDSFVTRFEPQSRIPGEAPFAVRGLEDARLVRWRGCWHLVGTVREKTALPGEAYGVSRVAVDVVGENGVVASRTVLNAPSPETYEKNWAPVVFRPETYVYSIDPFKTVGHGGWTSGEIPQPSARGGSQLVLVAPYQALAIVHDVEWTGGERFYWHFFASVNLVTNETTFGPKFSFLGPGTEFCAGLIYEPARGRFVATFGQDERAGYLAVIPSEPVLDSVRGS